MAITASDLKIRLSGGSSNSDVNASLGGAKSSTEVTDNTTHNLFDLISGTESLAGEDEYRCVYLHNGHGSLTAQNTKVYIGTNTPSGDTNISIALAGEGLNATAETISDENTPPSGETFSSPTSYATGLNMGNIPAGQHYALWIKRTVGASAVAVNDDSVVIKYDCDTAA